MFCRSLFVLLYFFLLVIVLSVLLRYTDSGCLPLVSSNSSYRIYTKIVFCKFSQYYWWTLHNCLFFSNKKLMMKRQFWLFMIFTSLINCWKMTIIKTNKQKTNKLKTNRKQTSKNKQTNKQSQRRKKKVPLKSYTKVYYICIFLKRLIRMDISTFVKQYYVCFK
jgi:hypothetical protein